MRTSRSTKAQAITLDFITGLVMMLVAIGIATSLIITIKEPSTFQKTKRQALAASDTLMSPGYPEDWNETNAIKIGLLTDNKLNLTKLVRVKNYTYDELRQRLNQPTNIYFYFMNATSVLNITGCGQGDPTVTTNAQCEPDIQADKNLIRIDRFITHENNIIRLVVIAWD